MKGVHIIYNETLNKRYVWIDMELIEKDRELVGDYLDTLVAERRKHDRMIPWEKAKAMLRKAGKL